MGQRQIIIHRVRPKETRIQNSIIWESNVSIAARFTLIAMLSLPDDWDYSVRGMAVMLGISKDTMSRYLRELETAEYLKRVQPHSEKGNFCKAEYILTDTPGNFGDEGSEDPCPKKPDTGAPPCPKNSDTDGPPCPNFPAPVLSAPEKSPQKKRTEEKNVNIPPIPPTGGRRTGRKKDRSVPAWNPERFEAFWEYYRTHARGEDRQGAVRAWDKLQPDDKLIAVMGKALQAQVQSELWREGKGIPYAATWLNNARWTDTPKAPHGPEPPEEEGERFGWR